MVSERFSKQPKLAVVDQDGLPDPLISEEIELNYPYFSTYAVEELGSPLMNATSAEEFRAAHRLKLWAWSRRPIGSLPNNDTILANLAGSAYFGSTDLWTEHKDSIMQEFILCKDNRWYHPRLVGCAMFCWKQKIGKSRGGKNSAKQRAEKTAREAAGQGRDQDTCNKESKGNKKKAPNTIVTTNDVVTEKKLSKRGELDFESEEEKWIITELRNPENYPRGNRAWNWRSALKAVRARLKEEIYTASELLQFAKNYTVACKADKKEPGFIMMPSTFFGPNMRFEQYMEAEPEQEENQVTVRRQINLSELRRNQ